MSTQAPALIRIRTAALVRAQLVAQAAHMPDAVAEGKVYRIMSAARVLLRLQGQIDTLADWEQEYGSADAWGIEQGFTYAQRVALAHRCFNSVVTRQREYSDEAYREGVALAIKEIAEALSEASRAAETTPTTSRSARP